MNAGAFRVIIDWGDGPVNLSNFGGVDLIRQDSFEREETLHRDLEPVQDDCSFTIDWVQSIANSLLTLPPFVDVDGNREPNIVTVDIDQWDGEVWRDWFTGYVRPVSGYNIGSDRTINIECLDNSWRLKRKPSEEKRLTNVTVTEAVDDLLTVAGYSEFERSEIGEIDDNILVFSYDTTEKEMWDILQEVLFAWGYIFYFDESGRFRTYQWIVDEISPAGFINDANILEESELNVDRDNNRAGFQLDPDSQNTGIDVPIRGIRTENHTVVDRSRGGSDGRIWFDGVSTGGDSSSPLDDEEEFQYGASVDDTDWVLGISNDRVVINFRRQTTFLGFPTGWTSETSSWSMNEVGNTRNGVRLDVFEKISRKRARVKASNQSGSTLAFRRLRVRADVEFETTVGTETADVPSSIAPVAARYISTAEAANRLVTALSERFDFSVFVYKASSEQEFPVGAYVSVQSTDLNTETLGRIIDRRWSYRSDGSGLIDIWHYEIEQVAELGDLVGAFTGVGSSHFMTSEEMSSVASVVDQGLDGDGQVRQPISANNFATSIDIDGSELAFTPQESGLYFTSSFLGFFDAMLEAWVVRLQNDSGTGKARFGSDGEYMEWTGTELKIHGAATIDGVITAGDDVRSADYEPGESGWAVLGDGFAEFNDVTVRGQIEADSGKVGNWQINDPDLSDEDNRIVLRSDKRRIEINDTGDVLRIALGFLQGIADFDPNDYGLYIRPGNKVRIEGGADFKDGDYLIESDAAYIVEDGEGNEVGRFGSLGVGDIGFQIGITQSGEEGIRYSFNDKKLTLRGDFETQSVSLVDEGLIGTSEDETRRLILSNDRIRFQVWNGESWETIKQLGEDDLGQFFPWLRGSGVVDMHADLNGVKFGTLPSDESALIFAFDETLDDLGESESFAAEGGAYGDGLFGKARVGGEMESNFEIPEGDFAMASWIKHGAVAVLSIAVLHCDLSGGELTLEVLGPWTDISSVYPHDTEIRSGVLRGDGVGIMVGDAGGVARTTDAGETWTDVSSEYPHDGSSSFIYDIALRGDGVGISVGGASGPSPLEVARTTDAGETWTDIGSAYPHNTLIRAVALREDDVGLAGGNSGELARTTDSGETWTSISNEYPHSGIIWSIVLRDDGIGLVGGNSGELARTNDHGQTWTDISNEYPHSGVIYDLVLRDDGVGVAVGQDGEIARTTDAGETWTDISGDYPHSGFIRGVALRTDGIGIAVADDGEIARTNDHGQTWTDISNEYPHSGDRTWVAILRDDGMSLIAGIDGEIARAVPPPVSTFTPPSDSAFHHYHLRRVGSNVDLHLDGTEVASLSDVDELSPAPLQIDLGPEYPDIAGGNHGEIVGDPKWGAGPNKTVAALQLDGQGDYVKTEDVEIIPASEDFTIVVWANLPANVTGNHALIGAGAEAGGNDMVFYACADSGSANNEMRLFSRNSSPSEVLIGPDIRGGGWKHVALVRSGNTATLYIDGQVSTSGTFDGSVRAKVLIGAAPHNINAPRFFLEGSVGAPRVYDQALTEIEISDLYEGSATVSDGLIAYWPGPTAIDDLLVLREAHLPQSEIDEYRSLGHPWTDDADVRDMRIQPRDGRDVNIVTTGGGKVLINGKEVKVED